MLRRNAGAGVAHRQTDELAGARLGMRRAAGAASKLDRLGGDAQLAAVGHGVAGVDDQVDEHLLDHAGVGLDEAATARRNGIAGRCARR